MSEIKAVPLPSGITNPQGSVGFVEVQHGLLECIDLANGTVLARSSCPLNPLLAEEEKLLAWSPSDNSSNSVSVQLTELSGGKLATVWQTPVSLPDWAETRDVNGHTFSLEATQAGDEFVLLWEAHQRYVGGMRPTDELLERVTKDAAGRVVIRAVNGDLIDAQPRQIPEEDLEALELACRLPMVPYLLGGKMNNKPWCSGEMDALILNQDVDGRAGLFLRHQDPVDRHTIDEALLVKETDCAPIVSLNGEHLFVHQQGVDSWTVFSTHTASRIASLSLESGIEAIAVLDSPDGQQVIYALDEKKLGPGGIATAIRRTLKACSLETGELMWSHFLFDKVLPPDPRMYPGMPGVRPG